MNAFFAPHPLGRELYLNARGDLIPVGVHAGQRPCPENVTSLSGENLTEIRRTHEITWIIPPTPPVPQRLTPRQIRDQIASDRIAADPARAGENIDDVVTAILGSIPLTVIASGTNLPLRTVALHAWIYSLSYLRHDPLLIQFSAELGYDTVQKLDAFFIAGAAR